MKERVSNRHEGTVGGILSPFGETKVMPITVVIAPESASSPATQHTAWMLTNLLARLQGVVRDIYIDCPDTVCLAGCIVPFAGDELDLRIALREGVARIGVVPLSEEEHPGLRLVVGGSGLSQRADLYVHGNGWCGGFSSCPLRFPTDSPLPFGPYVAACLAAGEIFKMARLVDPERALTRSVFYSLWELVASEVPSLEGVPAEVECSIDAALAGVGAVGSAFLHALWATPGVTGRLLIADNDRLDETNLNRYVLFGRESLGAWKASEAAKTLATGALEIHAHDQPFQALTALPARVVSAVDTNRARSAVQDKYPARILSASTLDLRAEILRCGPPGVNACLRCINVPEALEADDSVRERAAQLPDSELAVVAERARITLDEARQWSKRGGCGVAGERLLPLLRDGDGEGAFSVGFVSVLAGTMLAASLVKECISAAAPLDDRRPRAVFQFMRPLAKTNRPTSYPRDPTCPKCAPNSIATQIWAKRYSDV